MSQPDLLFVGSGSQGEVNRPMFGVKPGASGDITLKPEQTSGPQVVWFQPRVSGYTPSPLLYRGRMYAVNDNGILTVFKAATGRTGLQGPGRRRRELVLELAMGLRRERLLPQ